MLFRTFAKEELGRLFELLSYNAVIGPTLRTTTPSGEQLFVFDHLENFSDLAFRYPTTVHSIKRFFLPHLQTIASYKLNEHSWHREAIEPDTTPTVLFGLHACDINALNRLDRILLDDSCPNPFYQARRLNTFIIGVDCQPSPGCFCKSLGCDQALHGYDMFITDLGDRYFCEINSGSAFEVIRGIDSREADHHDHTAFVLAREAREKQFVSHVDSSDLVRILDMEFEATAWHHWGQQCLSCGTCANVCPTCYCYGTEHVVETDLRRARKVMRLYSCNLIDFAEIAENRNFRPESATRIKYRYYHKHRGFVEAFEEALCVGCGRCGRACLASITVPEVIASIREEAATHD